MKNPKPHASAALAQLRPGVTSASLVVVLCVIVQLLVFGFVHFTEIRYEPPKPTDVAAQPLNVVPSVRREPPAAGSPKQPDATPEPAPAEVRELSSADEILRQVSNTAAALGIASAAVLWFMIFLGVIVAAAASVPGVEKAVSACTWSLVLAIVCLPWRYLVPTAPFPGIFSSYAAMTDASATVAAGSDSTAGLLGTYLLLPVVALVVSMIILGRFRAGVDAGVIIQSVTELDRAIEREAGEITRRGISVSGPRTVGALNQAIGSAQITEQEPPPRRLPREEEPTHARAPMPDRIADGLPRPAPPPRERRFQQDEDDGFRRPI